ncbi:MAG: diguanylate cyclase [Oceanospirillaceae bacterium]
MQAKPTAFNEQTSIALGRFIDEVSSASSEQMVYSILTQNLNSLIPNDRASVTLLNAEKNMLEVFSLHSFESAIPAGKRLPLDNTYTGWAVLQHVAQYHVIDAHTQTLDGQMLFKQGIRSIINAPIIIHGQSIGAINTAIKDPTGFNDRSLALLVLIARLVSTYLEHHKLLQEREQALQNAHSYAAQLENLNQLAQQLSTVKSVSEIMQICEKIVQNIMPSQRVSYARYQAKDHTFEVQVLSGQEQESLRLINAKGTSLELILIDKQPVFFPDLSLNPNSEHNILYKMGMRSSISIPINVEGEIVGILSAASKKVNTQDTSMIQVLGAMGAIISGAMQRIRSHEKLNYQANYDTLTGLPNRHMFYTQLNSLFSCPTNPLFATLFVDLDHFKHVNDSLGHQAGDELLNLVATRICKVIRKGDLAARIGGDEFIVLIADNCTAEISVTSAQQIINSLCQPFNLQGNTVSISASIGISLSNDNISCVDDIIQKADTAMYLAKSKGGATYEIS